jgi:hypothetical protein
MAHGSGPSRSSQERMASTGLPRLGGIFLDFLYFTPNEMHDLPRILRRQVNVRGNWSCHKSARLEHRHAFAESHHARETEGDVPKPGPLLGNGSVSKPGTSLAYGVLLPLQREHRRRRQRLCELLSISPLPHAHRPRSPSPAARAHPRSTDRTTSGKPSEWLSQVMNARLGVCRGDRLIEQSSPDLQQQRLDFQCAVVSHFVQNTSTHLAVSLSTATA